MLTVNIEKKEIDGKTILENVQFDHASGITLILGNSGEGKTQLVQELVPGLMKQGTVKGEITYNDRPIQEVRPGEIGYVSQNIDNQIVTETVWSELAFGAESVGMPRDKMRFRIAEIASYLGLDTVFNESTRSLSGGQKQRLCIGSVLVAGATLIIMDEPSSMLDPVSKRELWNLVYQLNRDIGISFIVVEHDSDYILEISNQVFKIEGKTKVDYFPGSETVYAKMRPSREEPEVAFTLKNIKHNYEHFTAVHVNRLQIQKGINCWIGPNGSGKTTLAKAIVGYYGKPLIKGSVYLPQDIRIVFDCKTVREEVGDYSYLFSEEDLNKHPMDLSGGWQHLAAVCKALSKNATCYILDEPTKGMDIIMKYSVLGLLKKKGVPVIIITHDMDLAVSSTSWLCMVFNGDITVQGEPFEVLSQSMIYKSSITRSNEIMDLKEVIY